jgi:SAM-dependent methyltransferase
MRTANHDQVEHWNDSERTGDWVIYQDRYDRMLEPFRDPILDAADLAGGEQVLDVGCGCGATTLAAARAVAPGAAAGVDLSAAMLARARLGAAAAGLSNASFEQADAQVHQFTTSYDAVISRLGVMFFADPVAAFANLLAATRTGGRLAFACWQPLAQNEWLLVPLAALARHVRLPDPAEPGAPGMFSLAEPDRLRQVLGDAGWREISMADVNRPIRVGGGALDDAIAFLRGRSIVRTMFTDVDQATQDRAMESAREALASRAEPDGVRLGAAVWLVTARR